jgi:hypothetical protein
MTLHKFGVFVEIAHDLHSCRIQLPVKVGAGCDRLVKFRASIQIVDGFVRVGPMSNPSRYMRLCPSRPPMATAMGPEL